MRHLSGAAADVPRLGSSAARALRRRRCSSSRGGRFLASTGRCARASRATPPRRLVGAIRSLELVLACGAGRSGVVPAARAGRVGAAAAVLVPAALLPTAASRPARATAAGIASLAVFALLLLAGRLAEPGSWLAPLCDLPALVALPAGVLVLWLAAWRDVAA